MTIIYITIQHKCGSLLLKFLHVDFSVWRNPAVWMLRFVGIIVLWLWLLTFFAAWPGQVPDDELGPVWVSFAGWQLHAPWAGTLWALKADGLSNGSAWLLRLCGLIMVVPAFLLARWLVGDCPRLPKKEDRFAYGGHLIEDADYRVSLGHAEASGVIVGHLKGLPWQKLSRLIRVAPSSECLILGEGRYAKSAFDAALKGFDGAIIRIGAQRLVGDLAPESDIIRIATNLDAGRSLDPLRQARSGTLAWFDIGAMLFPCGFNERQRILATAVLVYALETAPVHQRTLADVVRINDDGAEIYARLNGWIDKTPLLGMNARAQLQNLLDYWAQAQGQVADDLPIIRERLWAVQRGWQCSSYGEPLSAIDNVFTDGPRVVSFEMKPPRPDNGFDPLSLPLMHLALLIRQLICEPTTTKRRPVIIALDADAPPKAVWLINLIRADLKVHGIGLLVRAFNAQGAHQAFELNAKTRLGEAFDTVIVTEPNSQTLNEINDPRHRSPIALASARLGEMVVVQKGKMPVRLHPADPDMVTVTLVGPELARADLLEPWSEAPIFYPNGAGLPKPKPVTIPKQSATAIKASDGVPVTRRRQSVAPEKQQSKPLVTKDDLASSTARLRKALAKRTAAPSQTQSRTI
jgi:hypothetical protein